MKNKISFVIGLLVVLTISLCLLVRYASHSTDEAVSRRAVMAYYSLGKRAELEAKIMIDLIAYLSGEIRDFYVLT